MSYSSLTEYNAPPPDPLIMAKYSTNLYVVWKYGAVDAEIYLIGHILLHVPNEKQKRVILGAYLEKIATLGNSLQRGRYTRCVDIIEVYHIALESLDCASSLFFVVSFALLP